MTTPDPVLPQLCDIGPLVLDTRNEVLLLDGSALRIGRRAVALLACLVRRPGEVVSKAELLQHAWAGLDMSESNLTSQMLSLRRGLSDIPDSAGWIETLNRRGYRFNGPVRWHNGAEPVSTPDRPHRSQQASIAVMPFQIRDGALQDEADRLAEDMILLLTGLREVVVIAAASTLIARNQTRDAIECGRSLGARYVLSATLRRAGDALEIAVELADCDRGLSLWSRRSAPSDRSDHSVLVPVVTLIVNSLAPRVREAELRRLQRSLPAHAEADQLVLRARELLGTHRREAFIEAKQVLDRALDADRLNSNVHDTLANWHRLMLAHRWSESPQADRDAVDHHIMRAISLNGLNSEALAWAAHARIVNHRDYDGALTLLDRALDAGPSNPKVWEISCLIHSWLGEGQTAVSHGEHALRLSPFDPLGCYVSTALCLAHHTLDRHETAMTWGYRSHAEQPRPGLFLLFMAASAAALGRAAEAGHLLDMRLPDHQRVSARAFAQRYPYRPAHLRDRLEELLRQAGCPA